MRFITGPIPKSLSYKKHLKCFQGVGIRHAQIYVGDGAILEVTLETGAVQCARCKTERSAKVLFHRRFLKKGEKVKWK